MSFNRTDGNETRILTSLWVKESDFDFSPSVALSGVNETDEMQTAKKLTFPIRAGRIYYKLLNTHTIDDTYNHSSRAS